MTRAGDLDRRITLRRDGEQIGEDQWGAPIFGPDIEHTVSASFTPVSDAEKSAVGEVMATMLARFVIRWSAATSEVTPIWTLEFEGEVWAIEGVKQVGRREGVELSASRRAE